MNAPHNIAKVTNQQGAIPISLLNSHFHSSIGTLHSKTCITLPALLSAAKHDNQVNTFTTHFLSHSESQDKSQTSKSVSTPTRSSMDQTHRDKRGHRDNKNRKDSLCIPWGKYKCDFM